MNFPLTDARENYLLELVEYYVEKPKYSVIECRERGLSYAVPLKAKLRLSTKSEDGKTFVDTIEQEVYLGNSADDDPPRHLYHQRRRTSW